MSKDTEKKVRFGVIGFGNQGSAYITMIKAHLIKNVELCAVCDINAEKLDKQYEKFHLSCAKFTDTAELFASGTVDAVVITTPHYFHPTIAIEALRAGLHVLCDKPAGVYTRQVKEMMAEAKLHPDQIFAIMFNQRTNKVYQKMRSMIADGTLGDVKRVNWIITDWYRTQAYYNSGGWRATWKGEGGGVLFNQAPHQLDLLPWIVGMMPTKMQAHCHFGKWHDIEVEDDVTAYMEFPNGATGVFITCTADYPGTNRLEVMGTRGKLVCESGRKLTFYRSNADEREFCKTSAKGFGTPGYKKIRVMKKLVSTQHMGILNNFMKAVLGIEPLFVPGFEGINGVEMMDSMLLSQWLGHAVDVPIDDDLYYEELQKRIAESKEKTNVVEQVFDTKNTY